MLIGVLGPVMVDRGIEHVAVDRPAQRRALSILGLALGSRVSTERLMDRFWPGDQPETGRAAIQTHISGLRRVLGDGVVVTEGYGYRLNLDDHDLDAALFASHAKRAAGLVGAREWQPGLDTIEEALDLWRGDPYMELVDDEFARAEISRLTELHLGLLETRAECLIGLGREQEILPDLEAMVVDHPYRERMWEQLMTARYRLGRHTEALEAFKHVSGHLAEIGVEPGGPLRRLEEKILLHDQSLDRTRHNLPIELDSFVGREQEIGEILKLLSDNRLVTLIGPGGSGKTRLATHTAGQLLDNYPDGIWYVELAALRDPKLIPTEIATTIGLSPSDKPMEGLQRALSRDRVLIIVDNCEHVLEETAAVTRALLESAPHVRILATSRESLRVPGEAAYELPGMTVPEDFDDVDAGDATRLFVERSRLALVSNRSSKESDSLDTVIDICRRLDGMPLAIELAAAQTATMSLQAISERLDDRFAVLSRGIPSGPSRHASLEAAIDWSYQLLTENERDVLLQLSVFRGGFDLEMADQVCSHEDVAPIVSSLVSKSMVAQYESQVGRRYRLLETIHEYAAVRLQASGQTMETRQNHLDWCLSFSTEARGQRHSLNQQTHMVRLATESENLTTALDWAQKSDNRDAVGWLSETLDSYWLSVGSMHHAINTAKVALANSSDLESKVYRRTRLSQLLFYTNEPEQSVDQAQNAYRLGQTLEPGLERLLSITNLADGYMLNVSEDPARALELAREAESVAFEMDDPVLQIEALRILANAQAWNGDTAAGIATAESGLAIAKGTNDPLNEIRCTQWLLHVLYMDRKARRHRPGELLSDLLNVFPEDDPRWSAWMARGWIPWALIQTGHLNRLEANQNRLDDRYLEGWALVEKRIERAAARWMMGRLQEAKQDVLDAAREGINPRWYHDYYPLRVDIFADLGELDEALASAEVYLDADVHPTEVIKKVGVLNPLVRASIEKARAEPDRMESLLADAKTYVSRMEQIIAEFPQPITGSISMEVPTTHLSLARAELSRLTGSDPMLWRDALNRTDFLYFRLYAQIRLGEALLADDETSEGEVQLEEALSEAHRIGASGLASLAEGLLNR